LKQTNPTSESNQKKQNGDATLAGGIAVLLGAT
jgi:hypothetical protein